MDSIRAKLVYVRNHRMVHEGVTDQIIYQFQTAQGTDIRFTTIAPFPAGWPVATERYVPEALPPGAKTEKHPNGMPVVEPDGKVTVRGDEGKEYVLTLAPAPAAPASVPARAAAVKPNAPA